MGTSKVSVTNTNKQLINGLQQYYANKSLMLAGKLVPAKAIIASLQKEDQLVASTAAARDAWTDEVAALHAQTAQNDQLRVELHAAVLVNFGSNQTALGAFGYRVPKKPGKRSPQSNVNAAQKRAATRVARGTMGPKEKLQIHGVVATPPATSPAAEAPTALPPNGTPQK